MIIVSQHKLFCIGFAILVSFSNSVRTECVLPEGKINPIIILGYVLKEDSSPQQELVDRVEKALEISHEIRNRCFILSGKGPRAKTESAVMMELLRERGISNDEIIEEPNSNSTEENSVFTKKILQKLNYNRPTLVTTSYHMPRARYYFERVIGPVDAAESSNPATTSVEALEKIKYIDTAVIYFFETEVFTKDASPDILSHKIRGKRRTFRSTAIRIIEENNETTALLKDLIDRGEKKAAVALVWSRL